MPRSRSRSASRSRSRSGGRYRSRSRSRSPSYRRKRDHSRSPMSNRRRHEGNRDAPQANTCLGVFGLSLYTTERELEKEFGKFGPIAKITVVLDGKTGRSRGFAFVTFEKVEDATEARNAMSDSELDGKKIRVDFSITKRAHTPTPGVYMGRPTSSGSSYRGGGGGRDYYRGDRYRRSPSPYYRRRSPSPRPRYRYRTRSRSYSPRRYY